MLTTQLNRSSHTHFWRTLCWRLSLTLIFLFLLLITMPLAALDDALLLIPGRAVWAQDAAPTLDEEEAETKPCSSCHSIEAETWQRSQHANQITGSPAASCTDCHGAYVRGHPESGVMELLVDSSNCGTCHDDTYDQWTHSLHASEGVQCISCHNSHDQELRLTDEKLCSSCHQEAVDDSLHVAHWENDVACTNCHLTDSPTHSSVASSVPFMAVTMAPSHDFVTVSATMCLECHRNDVLDDEGSGNDGVSANGNEVAVKLTAPAANSSPVLTSKLASAEKSNQFLTMLSTINLGFGIGIGGILGMLFVLVGAAINKRGERS